MQHISHWIGGRVVKGTSGRSGPVFNPATAERTGEVDFASAAEVGGAVASAAGAAREWADSTLSARTEILFRFHHLVKARRDEIARLVTAEHGKVLSDAAGEVARGLENVEFACGIPHLLKGGF